MRDSSIIKGGQHLSRAQRRELKKLSARVDKITAADRIFFERFKDRRHRVRVAARVEIEQAATATALDEYVELPVGMTHFAVVKSIRPGVRIRAFFFADEGIDTDLCEEAVACMFERLRARNEMIRETELEIMRKAEFYKAAEAPGELIERFSDDSGKELISVYRLPGNMLAVEIPDDGLSLALAKSLLPETMRGVTTLANGERRWRFVYREAASNVVNLFPKEE